MFPHLIRRGYGYFIQIRVLIFLLYVSFHWKAAALLQMSEKFFFFGREIWMFFFLVVLISQCSPQNRVPLVWVAAIATNRVQCCLISDILKNSQFNWKRWFRWTHIIVHCWIQYSLFIRVWLASVCVCRGMWEAIACCACVFQSTFDDGWQRLAWHLILGSICYKQSLS